MGSDSDRALRALKNCMSLDPPTKLYQRLFITLASALVKAFETKGTPLQQKCVFLMESTLAFECVQTESGP